MDCGVVIIAKKTRAHLIRIMDWSVGKDYPGLDELEPILQPEFILKASDEEIIEQMIPKFCFHLTNEQIPLLRKSARRDRIQK